MEINNIESIETPPDILPSHQSSPIIQQATHPVLDICTQVRNLLVENGIDLALDFPIIESEKSGVIRGMQIKYKI